MANEEKNGLKKSQEAKSADLKRKLQALEPVEQKNEKISYARTLKSPLIKEDDWGTKYNPDDETHFYNIDEPRHYKKELPSGAHSEPPAVEPVMEPQLPYILFKNTLLNVVTAQTHHPTPQIIPGTQLQFNFTPLRSAEDYSLENFEKLLPNFFRYIRVLCCNDAATINCVRCFLTCLIHGYTQTHTFLYLLGPEASGKTVFTQICTALVSQEKTISTNLAQMSSENFETGDFKDKRLVLINEDELYIGPMNRLKQLTGGDLLSGRDAQGYFNFTFYGLVIVTSNNHFSSFEPSKDLKVRERYIATAGSLKAESQESLLYWCAFEKKWKGRLSDELGHIFNWAFTLNLTDAAYYLKTCNWVGLLGFFIQEFFVCVPKKTLKIGFTKAKNLEHADKNL